LTRASIILRKSFVEEMDCRVKPGNDDPRSAAASLARGSTALYSLVMPGLDPGIHHSSQEFC
jgi:hypothetical protein